MTSSIDQDPVWLERRGALAAAVLLAWTLLAAIPSTSAFIAAGRPGFAAWWGMFAPIVTYYYLWALVSPLVYLIVVRWPLNRETGWRAALAHFGFWLVFTTVTPFIVHANNWDVWLYGSRAFGYHAMGFFTYSLTLMSCLALKHYRLGLARERDAARVELRNAVLSGQLSLARIDALRMQINPHFLFNALNSIAALIETDRKDQAYHTTELLGALLRIALEPCHQARVSLDEELDFVERYLQIESIRFGDTLHFETAIDPETRNLGVPALILQPLVENAIKHAVAPSTRPVHVVLRVRREGSDLVIEVTDDGPGFQPHCEKSNGQGLANVRERLRLLFDDASLKCSSPATGGAHVALRFPALPLGADSSRSPQTPPVAKLDLVT